MTADARQDPSDVSPETVPTFGPQAEPGGTLARLAVCVLATALVGLLAVQVWKSLDWPLVQDPPLMHYLGWRMTEGDVPYRDFFDMNFPGTLLLHWGIVKYLGPGDAAWRGFNLAWLALTMLAAGAYLRRLGWVVALGGALLIAVLHLEAGPLHAGQRDFLMIALLLVSAHFVARYCERGCQGLAPLAVAGLVAGACATIKPMAVLFWAGLGLFAALAARRQRRGFWAPLLTVAGAGMVPVAAAVVWLAAIGALPAFCDILFNYLLPLYGREGRLTLTDLADRSVSVRIFLVLLALSVVPYVRMLAARRMDARRGLLLLGLGYGLVHYVLQGKGWIYHQAPQTAFACLLAVSAWSQRGQNLPATRRWQLSAAMAAVLLTGAFGLRTYSDYPVRLQREKVAQLMQDISPRLRAGQTVQVLDTTQGGLDALLRLKVRQPTVFIYDFHFYLQPDQPYIQRLRQRFLEQLTANPPQIIVLFKETWPLRMYERVERFPALAKYLRTQYELAVERDDYRLLVRRTGPAEAGGGPPGRE